LTEDGERVAAGDVDPLEGAVGGAGAAGNRSTFLEREFLGEWNAGERRRFHVARVAAVTRHAVDGDPRSAELRPAETAVPAGATPLVVVVHHALADEGGSGADAHCGPRRTRSRRARRSPPPTGCSPIG